MLSPELRQRLANLSTALLADARVRLKLPESHLDPGIRPVVPFTTMIGTAVTVELEAVEEEAAADLTPLLDAYQAQSRPGSIIVIQIPRSLHSHGIFWRGGRHPGKTTWLRRGLDRGGRPGHAGSSQDGVPGLVANGGARLHRRQVQGCRRRPGRAGRRMHHSPGGRAIAADNDGVIVIRPDQLEAVIARAEAIKEWEHRAHQASSDGADYQEILRRAGPMP